MNRSPTKLYQTSESSGHVQGWTGQFHHDIDVICCNTWSSKCFWSGWERVWSQRFPQLAKPGLKIWPGQVRPGKPTEIGFQQQCKLQCFPPIGLGYSRLIKTPETVAKLEQPNAALCYGGYILLVNGAAMLLGVSTDPSWLCWYCIPLCFDYIVVADQFSTHTTVRPAW